MHDLSESPPRAPTPEETLKQARVALAARGVSVCPQFWAVTLEWFAGARNVLPVPAEAVCMKYLNVVRDDIHEALKRR